MGLFAQQPRQDSQLSATPSSLSRSSTLSSETVTSSSSLATIPSSSSATSLRAFFSDPKEYFAPSVFYAPSPLSLRRGMSIKEAKRAVLEEIPDKRSSAEVFRPPAGFSTRKRANSAAALIPPLWIAPPTPPLARHDSWLSDESRSRTVGQRNRRGSAEDVDSQVHVTFVREHRRSRSSTPTDRNRRPPSPKLASGKVLSPLPELIGTRKSAMVSALESSRRSPTKMSRSPDLTKDDLLQEAVESDEDTQVPHLFPTTRMDFRHVDSENINSAPLSRTRSADKIGPSGRSLQGRRSLMRTHTTSVHFTRPSSIGDSSQASSTIRIDFPTESASSKETDVILPLLPPSTTFRPKSRRTLSLPFAPHLLPRTAINGPMLPPPAPSRKIKSPFHAPASALKAPSVCTTLSTSSNVATASLSTFSSWDFPVASNADTVVGRHRVLSHLSSYDLPNPGQAPPSTLSPVRAHLTSSPSSFQQLSPTTTPRVQMGRAHTQPLVSSRLGVGASSPAPSLSSQPTPLKRASTISHHHRPSTGNQAHSGSGRQAKVPKLRMPTSYSLQNSREIPSAQGPLSPSTSMDGLALSRTRSRDRRGSTSSAGSFRDSFRFPPAPTPPRESPSAGVGGMLRSSSAVSLAGLLNLGRRPSLKDADALRARQEEMAHKAMVAAALQAEEDSDEEEFISFTRM